MTIELRDVTKENWVACAQLSLHEDQMNFVASNMATIAESRFEPHHVLRAIYCEDTPVGMLAYCRDDEDGIEPLYWLFRFMVDKDQQARGYGQSALDLCVDEMRQLGAAVIRTMHKPENTVAGAMYRNYGFQPRGELDDGDFLLELEL